MTLYQKFQRLDIDPLWIGLEKGAAQGDYFCTPKGARVIGWEGCIHYCFIRGYGEMVFAVDPESCGEECVYPLAADFRDFLRLILACAGTTAAEQIAWWSRADFDTFLASEDNTVRPEQRAVLETLARELRLTPMEQPYDYVKEIQARFDRSKLRYTDAYYDTLGLARPDGTEPVHQGFDFPPVIFTFEKKEP